MTILGNHALLSEIVGGVIVIGSILALTLKKKKTQVVETLTADDMRRIDERVTGDVARTESRFRRRYGVDAKPKDFAKPKDDEPKA